MRGNEVSKTHRERIIGAYLSGIRQRVISTQLNIPTSTVSDIIKKYKKTGSSEPRQRSGRPKILSECDTRALKRIVRTDRFSPLGNVTDKLNTSLDATVHYNTVRSYLHDEGLGSYTARKKT
ncbi:13523_t:CDS:1 [Funneliformis geosporum]|uniref:13523_t:CDS:1 n=1 Tax=Funneliformis geosporum TaxID=1117311 RepID=A0A9W4SXF8_9GLOM|nr:13523_t:CDS:1 [Funneliformis geosporum]